MTDPATARMQEEEQERDEEKRKLEAAQAKLECPTSPQEKPNIDERAEECESATSPESPDKSFKSRGKRVRQKEVGSETPTLHSPPANHVKTEEPASPPQEPKKPQETEHISPAVKVPEPTDSDTDSATEEDLAPPSCIAKRKATEHRTPDKKIRLDHKDEAKVLTPEKNLDTGRLAETRQEAEEQIAKAVPPSATSVPPPVETRTDEPEVKTEMPSLTREIQIRVEPLPDLSTMKDTSAVPTEELMPQIGPEALMCHEVDLDDPEEKEKPTDELPVLKEVKPLAPNTIVTPVQPPQPLFHLPPSLAATVPVPRLCSPSSAPSPDESHSTKSESDVTVEADSMAESHEGLGENFDASASSSNSSISLQERDAKDRGQSLHQLSLCL